MRTMSLLRKLLLWAVVSMLFSSCTTTLITYGAENLKGNGVMDEANMLVDYGKFAVQYSPEGDATILNKSDSTLFIDMGASYYLLNGEAQLLFNNSVTTNFSSGTQGATVNMGSVASAMGVGGALGTLAKGVNVGASSTSGSSTQVFEQRYISIPPMSRKAMKSADFTSVDKEYFKDVLYPGQWISAGKLVSINNVTEHYYDRYSVPNHEYAYAYTFDPNLANFQSTRDLFYIKSIVADESLKDVKVNKNQSKRWELTRKGHYAAATGTVIGALASLILALYAAAIY